jgi:hypothetical protein
LFSRTRPSIPFCFRGFPEFRDANTSHPTPKRSEAPPAVSSILPSALRLRLEERPLTEGSVVEPPLSTVHYPLSIPLALRIAARSSHDFDTNLE